MDDAHSGRPLRCRAGTWTSVLRALVLLPAVKVMLWRLGFQRTQAVLARRLPPSGAAADHERLRELTAGVTVVARLWPAPGTCLTRSLGLWWLARRTGFDVELAIGMARHDRTGDLMGHAWVEHRGVPVNDSPDVRLHYPIPITLPFDS